MTTNLFEQSILNLNFSFITEGGESGVLLTSNFQDTSRKLSSPDILFALETAQLKFNADAVYFRYFEDGRASVPQLYIFDYTTKTLTEQDKKRIQIQMWNGYQVPAYIIIESSTVSFFDSREKPRENLENYACEVIKLTGAAIKEFNAHVFDNGLFWEDERAKNHFRFEQSATRDLIRGLKEVYKSFQEKSGLDRHVALKLLVQCLLIKYLEERDEDSLSGYFAVTYFKRNFQCENFCDTIRKGKLLSLLDQLAKDFKGKIFEWNVNEEVEQRIAIERSEVVILADYLDGQISNNQYVIWRLYSFSHLPVEVISSVYEELLTDSKDIVYTPEMIVSTLVDECMPLKNPIQNFKLIDVSCGSGIFLVKAYKRLVQWWRYSNWITTGELVKPPLSVLRELLLKSIRGLDIEQDAVRLSIFSLALAILDEVNLDPPTWGKLQFPDLSENIVSTDFFRAITTANEGEFDLVIGNPPFNLQLVNGKEPNRKAYFKKIKNSFGYQSTVDIPDENPALHFLTQSIKLLKKGGLLSMIQPSGPLLYKNDTNFRAYFLAQYNLLQIIDFTRLSDKLWGRKNVATVAVFIQNSEPDTESVLHLICSRTFSNLNRLFLEFDHYDFHFVSKEEALNSSYIWKANLVGGGRIATLVERLRQLPTFGDYLAEKVKKHGWAYSEGYTIGNKKHKADFIHGKTAVRPEHLSESGVTQTSIETAEYFEAPRKSSKEIYLRPHILIRENIGKAKIPLDLLDYDAVFSHEIVGIYAPERDVDELKKVFQILKSNNDLYRFYILSTSARILVGRATSILKRDIDSLPFTLNLEELIISEADEIIVKEVLSLWNSDPESLRQDITFESIDRFSHIFCKTLNSIYEDADRLFHLFEIIDAGKYFALHFRYDKEGGKPSTEVVSDLHSYIEQIMPSTKDQLHAFHIQRIFKVYGNDSLLLVKPKQRKYWLDQVALKDADETFSDYIKVRYYAEE